MNTRPHPIPYQGSKRKLSPTIFSFVENNKYDVLYEPFAGSAAFTIYAASKGLAENYVIGDSLTELVELWDLIINHPVKTAESYRKVWMGQKDGDLNYFNSIRTRFNSERDPIHLLYLIVRCVKNAVRFNKDGFFTQSADKRRKGTKPDTLEKQIQATSQLLKGRVSFYQGDYIACIKDATKKDLVYMDPPYQGTSEGRDKRYFEQLEFRKLADSVKELNKKEIDFMISYDGKTGSKIHGIDLPASLNLSRIYINAGKSAQSTLSGRNEITLESLYLSEKIAQKTKHIKDEEYLCNGQKLLLLGS